MVERIFWTYSNPSIRPISLTMHCTLLPSVLLDEDACSHAVPRRPPSAKQALSVCWCCSHVSATTTTTTIEIWRNMKMWPPYRSLSLHNCVQQMPSSGHMRKRQFRTLSFSLSDLLTWRFGPGQAYQRYTWSSTNDNHFTYKLGAN